MEALEAGARSAYEAANKVANEAFSKSFFMQLTLSATFFWPVFFLFGWMQYRFLELEFPIPFTGLSLGYIGVFILLYIPVYILFKKIKHKLSSCRGIKEDLGSYQTNPSIFVPASPPGPKGSIPEPEKP
jgi:hypothetical protein